MAKRGVNFDAFDRELADSKPELAARIGVQQTDEPAAVQQKTAVPAPPSMPALRVVAALAPEGIAEPAQEPLRVDPPRRDGKLRGRVQRADGSESGRQIVYLPIALDERLRRYAFESGRALTDVTSELLSDAIEKNLPPLR